MSACVPVVKRLHTFVQESDEKMLTKLVVGSWLLGVAFGAVSKTETEDAPQIWALLVAGSNGWGNYRHQVPLVQK